MLVSPACRKGEGVKGQGSRQAKGARAVLFDMDGVLAFTEQFYNHRRVEYLAEHGITFDEEPDCTGSFEQAIWERLVPGDEQLRERLRVGYRAYSDEHPTPWAEVANPDVEPTFRALKERGVLVGIASSSYRSLIEGFVAAAGVGKWLDLTLSGEECAAYKPDPDIYLTAMRRLGVSPAETVIVEDSPTGILAGVRSGSLVVALRPPAGVCLDQSRADVVVDRLPDVVELLGTTCGSQSQG